MSVKLEAALGFCAKAGKVKSGEFIVEKNVKNGTAKLVIADSSASDATRGKWQGICSAKGIPYLETENAGKLMGKPGNKLFAVTDEGFYKLIMQAKENCDNTQTTREVKKNAQ